jgi:hypothetical protein
MKWITTGSDGSELIGTWDGALVKAKTLEANGIGWRVSSFSAVEPGESMPEVSIKEANREVSAAIADAIEV